ncbi:hypothetical protein B0H10DRAFT_2222157 [Mycena sp. CBHHK59/15]|nr:hypothetical protein B0H10DRAFT_2222157 [Mycena sp. CBHHK59/15]
MPALPAELWTQVFDLAADEDVIFQYGIPGVMAESAWFKNVFEEWVLRPPQDALHLVQRRSYATKKAIVATCKKWRTLGSEFLFRCFFINDPARLQTLCAILDSSSATSTTASASLGWWTRRIHLTRYYASATRGMTAASLQDVLVSIIRHCPNLEIFIVDWPMAGSTFAAVADALTTFSHKSLRTLHINVPSSALSKVIWTLHSLRALLAVHLDLEAPTPDDEAQVVDETHLGAAGHWLGASLLRHLSLDCGTRRTDIPDVPGFLAAHGASLLFLDLNAIPALPVPRVLAACPALTTFAFNADWRIVVPDDEDDSADPPPPLAHERLTSVGLHGLGYAFGVGYAAAHAREDPLPALLVTSANDRTFAALCDRARFPALRQVRVLSRSLLNDLNRADGPSKEEGGMERWERWWAECRRAGLRFEDCTGGFLGELPHDEVDESDEDEEDSDDESEWELDVPPVPREGGSQVEELRLLLEECRAMDAGRDDNYMFASPEAQSMFPGITITPPVASASSSSS